MSGGERIAKALVVLLATAFPGDEILTGVVQDWVRFETAPPPHCAVCGRSINLRLAAERERKGTRFWLLMGRNAGASATCAPCIDAARDAFEKPLEGRPVWDMVLSRFERALGLLPADDAAIVRECLSNRPNRPVEGMCALCKQNASTVRGRTGGICQACSRNAAEVMQDLAVRAEVERTNSNCPNCHRGDIAARPVGIEFTELICLSCTHSDICDVWQLADWRD